MDKFARVLDANGIMVRVALTPEFQPQPFTIAGWEVSDIKTEVARLDGQGVRFEMYGMKGQDEQGIWSSPSGAKVAWFKTARNQSSSDFFLRVAEASSVSAMPRRMA